MFSAVDLYYTEPMQAAETTRQDLHDLDRYLSDTWTVSIVTRTATGVARFRHFFPD